MSEYPGNLKIITAKNSAQIATALLECRIRGAYQFTHALYQGDDDLASFIARHVWINAKLANLQDAFVVIFPSDECLRKYYKNEIASVGQRLLHIAKVEGRTVEELKSSLHGCLESLTAIYKSANHPPQTNRMERLLIPLAQQLYTNNVIGVFYDDPKPEAIYRSLSALGAQMGCIHTYINTVGDEACYQRKREQQYFSDVLVFAPIESDNPLVDDAPDLEGKRYTINLQRHGWNDEGPLLDEKGQVTFAVTPPLLKLHPRQIRIAYLPVPRGRPRGLGVDIP
jgi:hypothetical protein